MATDVEESDTDEHDRPDPPKRQCTRSQQQHINEVPRESNPTAGEDNTAEVDEAIDEEERRTNEKLKRWQACQVANGFVDNTINRVLENYIMSPSTSYALDESRSWLFRDNEMEDTAVMMAIRNYGLVQSTHLTRQSATLFMGESNIWLNGESNSTQQSCDFNNSATSISSNAFKISALQEQEDEEEEEDDDDDDDEGINKEDDDSNQQQDFLERAVAEAIKKKGLSALSVDYG